MNQVVSYRMAKKRQMRWTDEGAHCMAQVRVAVLNGEFSPQRISSFKTADTGYSKCIGRALAGSRQWTEQIVQSCRKLGTPDKISLPNFRTLSLTADAPVFSLAISDPDGRVAKCSSSSRAQIRIAQPNIVQLTLFAAAGMQLSSRAMPNLNAKAAFRFDDSHIAAMEVHRVWTYFSWGPTCSFRLPFTSADGLWRCSRRVMRRPSRHSNVARQAFTLPLKNGLVF
ncbi:hypothetical protein [Burkholderia sp. Ac-20353]|uniref:hypothetical protein n=1 Tax=Burkholderia sp. Ac-20353 TaxID=2703894 RepID=UPI00197B598B|nr:hypothetical protein [Burkholderia sp. Ac-20353]MBN3785594.1 hypothetical protein [Burkholderia sp. Ac-20353]